VLFNCMLGMLIKSGASNDTHSKFCDDTTTRGEVSCTPLLSNLEWVREERRVHIERNLLDEHLERHDFARESLRQYGGTFKATGNSASRRCQGICSLFFVFSSFLLTTVDEVSRRYYVFYLSLFSPVA